MQEQTDDSDKLELLLQEERDKQLLTYLPLLNAERQHGSFSCRYAMTHCGVSEGEAYLIVEAVCDDIQSAILRGSGPLSPAHFRAYVKTSIEHEAARRKQEWSRTVFLDAAPRDFLPGSQTPVPGEGPSPALPPPTMLIELLNVFAERLLPPDGLSDAGAARPVTPELHCALAEYLAQQTRADGLSPHERSLRRAVKFAAVKFDLDRQGEVALQRRAYRRFDDAKREALDSVPAARPLVEKLTDGKLTPARLGELFGYVWQFDADDWQDGSVPRTFTARGN